MLADWDRKAKALAQTIDRSAVHFRKHTQPSLVKLEQTSVKVAEQQRNFELLLEQISDSLTYDLLVSDKQKALLHWARKWAQQITELYYVSRNLRLFALWCQLLYVRCTRLPTFLQNAVSYSALGPELQRHKAFLATRHQELIQQLAELMEHREKLLVRYQQSLIMEVNRQAMFRAESLLFSSFPLSLQSLLLSSPPHSDEEQEKLQQLVAF
jgi:hypothetical protein